MDYLSSCPKPDLKMDLTILSLSCNPGDVLITFQGRYISSVEHDYHVLKTEIQLVPKVNEDLDIGQFCLVQDKPFGLWHRGKILDKVKQRFEVVLIDQGKVVKVAFEQIASATGELFELPPKIVNGIFSNVFPLDEKWSPRAKSFFSNLVGEQVNGHVKTFLPHQVILLEVPKVIDYAIELKVAKYMDSDTFCLLVETIHKFPANSHGKQMPDLLQQRKLTSDTPLSLNDNQPRFQKMLDRLRPEISVGTLEKIKLSSAVSPERFYCHILSWETELQKLTASMCSHYEALKTNESNTLGNYSTLCAAKRKDGLWYRGIIQTVLSSHDVKVLFFDIGSSETILSADIHQLKHEFLMLPMLAIPCALSRVNDFVESTRKMQLFLFKQALLGHIVIAHIEEFCSDEKVFSIMLYKKEYELSSDCHLTNHQVPLFSPNSCTNVVKTEHEEKSPYAALPEASVSNEMSSEGVISYKCLQLDPESVHVAYVEYVLNPSNFWIRTDECQNEFVDMMAEIAERYDKCELTEMLLEDPQPGQLCCALYAKDRHYYRALITDVLNPEISVYFIDFGNTETVPFHDVKVLLPKFSTLPALVICCTLAYAYPHEDVWVKSANDAFKKIVAGKALLCHVLKKHRFKYVVEMRLLESSENSDIVSLLVQAGYAEFWKTDLNSSSVDQMCPLPEKSTKYKDKKSNGKHSFVRQCVTKGDIKVSIREWKMKTKSEAQTFSFCEPSNNRSSNIYPIYFKQYTFKPGGVTYVKCSHVGSPGHFWCQLSCNLTQLDTLMDELQTFYESCNSSYLHGQMACIARSSCTRKFYRASVVKHVSIKEVDVIFVDYGRVERVLISELREIKPQFLEWEGQAFRCCLSKALASFGVHHTWSTSACQDFKSLVGSADDIKCTVITVLGCASEDLSNVVDLETSCDNANRWLATIGHLTFEGTVPPVHLHTFCYSNFDLEVGRKEYVYVTYIYNTGKFYCQLAKNEETVEALMRKVTALGERISPETGKNVQGVCIAKYIEDGHFYRALVRSVDCDNFLAFFVDYGNSHMVKKTDLLLIPEEATDVLFEPMQAIPCYLSGLKEATFTKEAKAWFEEQCFDTPLSALIISRDNEGQLEMDLFCGNTSVNSKIKEMGVELKPQENAVNAQSSSAALPVRAKQHTLPDLSKKSDSEGKDNKTSTSDLNGNVIPCVKSRFLLDGPQNSIREALQKEPLHDTVQASKLPSLPHVGNSCSPLSLKEPLKSTDLPQMILETGSTHLVYASHICSSSEFYIHLAKNEKQVLKLAEELNDMSLQPIDVNHLEKGTLVVAQYPDDKAFYRAEIKEILKSNSFEVEFIDYGNTSKVDFLSIFKLPERFFNVPRLSISVLLTGAQKCQNGKWSKIAMDKFSEQVTKESFGCVFLCRHGSQWEVSITLEGKSVTEFLQSFETPPESSASVKKDTIPDVVLKPSQIEKVKTVYLSKSGTLFVTLASYAEDSELGEQISAVVKQANNQLVAKDISEGMVCLVKSEKMQTWFRAAVEQIIPGTAEMSVFFVDHGAHEVVSMLNAKSISAAALSVPRQAVPCEWIWMEKVGIHFFRSQMQSLLQKEGHILFLNFLQAQSCWKVDLLVNNTMLIELFNTAPQPIAQNISKSVSCFNFETEMFPSSIPRVPLKSFEVQAGFVTAFQNPFSFSVQLENSVVLMSKLSKLTPKLTDDLLPFTADMVRLGSACLVKCFGVDEWCRAEIASINMSSVSLNLLDYGVYKSIPYSDYSSLKVISKEMASLPALTYHCRLYGVLPKNGNGWSEDALKYCMNFIQDCDLMILPVKIMDNNATEVSIYGKGNWAEKLISQGLAIVTSNNGCVPGAAKS